MLEPLSADDPTTAGPFVLTGRLRTATGRNVYIGQKADGTAAELTVLHAGDPDLRRRFAQDVAAAGRIRSRHVPALLDADTGAAHPWVAGEHVTGPSVREVVDEGGPLTVAEILRLIAAAGHALAAIHEVGLVHGALDADHVVLSPEGPRVVGLGDAPGSAEADVVALGTLIAQLAGDQGALDEGRRRLDGLARRCLAPDPADRPTPSQTAEYCEAELATIEPATGLSDPLAYVGTDPPARPHDLSTSIPRDAVVGPLTTPVTEPADQNPLAYPAVDPPANPLDLSAGLPDAGPGPRQAPAEPEPETPPPERPRRRRFLAGVVATALALGAVVAPVDGITTGTPATPTKTRPACTGARYLTGGGSTLQHDAVLTIAAQWSARCAGSLSYDPSGTDHGVARFAAGETDLAVVDHALGTGGSGELAAAAARCAGTGAPADKNLVLQLPIVFTPIALPYHLPGVPGLRLDAPTLTAIFSGRVTAWNDRTIAALNAGTRLPATTITVIARAGEAQTTQTLQEYLTAIGGWRAGSGPEFAGRATLTRQSDTEVLAAVRALDGAIGYVPRSSTDPTDEPVAALVPGTGTAIDADADADAGKAAAPDPDAVAYAVETVLPATEDLTRLPAALYQAGTFPADSGTAPYPLVHVGFVVACTRYPAGKAAAVKDFLRTALAAEQPPARGYVLPSGVLRLRLLTVVERTY